MKIKELKEKLESLDENEDIFLAGEAFSFGCLPDDVEEVKKLNFKTINGKTFEGYVII